MKLSQRRGMTRTGPGLMVAALGVVFLAGLCLSPAPLAATGGLIQGPERVFGLGSTVGSAINLTVTTSAQGQSSTLSWAFGFPITVRLLPNAPGPSPFAFFWDFGDGTNSTAQTPTHVYASPCAYPISLSATDAAGHTSTGKVTLVPFGAKGPNGAILVCPSVGTAGFTPVSLYGGFFAGGIPVNTFMDGASARNTTTSEAGTIKVGVTSLLPPRVNGSTYVFTSIPDSTIAVFTTVEGIQASPNSGNAGDNVTVVGRSYPPNSFVTVSLGGVELGTAQTDSSGSFLQTFQIPNVAPLNNAGTYVFTTSPPILGVHASPYTTGTVVGPGSPQSIGTWLWLLILLLFLILLGLLIYLLTRRRPRWVVGTEANSDTVHFQDTAKVGFSFCGKELKETWKVRLKKGTTLKDLGSKACEPCYDDWKRLQTK